MVTCELCGREFKNTQGLNGHKRFFHGNRSSSNAPATPVVTESELSKLEGRLEQLESITGLDKVGLLGTNCNSEVSLFDRLFAVTEQLNSLTRQLVDISSNTASDTDLQRISSRVDDLAQQLSSYSKWFQPVGTITGIKSHLEDELNSRAKNTRVNTLENRVGRLEDYKTDSEALMKSVAEVVGKLVDKFQATIGQLQGQLGEQKLVTDWVKKEYKLSIIHKTK